MLNPTPQKGEPRSPTSPSKKPDAAGKSAVSTSSAAPSKKRFQNGWTREIEQLMAEWADKAICYRWMHEKTERIYSSKDMAFMFPVIILSTITGAANFAMDSVLQDPEHKKYAQLGLGGMSIATGIISTIANRLGYASGSEAHKGAAIQWGKFQRLIAIELSLHPDERSDCMHFLKMCRADLDRLIEQSPTIPDSVISACAREFAKYPAVRKPEIVGDIGTTHVFVDTNSRLREVAREAAISIAQKKGVLKQIVLDDLEPRIQRVLEFSSLPALREDIKKEVQRAVSVKRAPTFIASTAPVPPAPPAPDIRTTTASFAQERATEVQKLATSGVVSAVLGRMRERVSEPPSAAYVPAVGGSEIILHIADDAELPAAAADTLESSRIPPPPPFDLDIGAEDKR